MRAVVVGLAPVVALTLVLLAGCERPPAAAPARVRVAAASDLKFALDDLLVAFRAARPDVEVEAVYGSSGNFYAQLSHRAPFDLFLSADVDLARRLADAGLSDGPPFPYAYGRLAVWAPRASPLDVEALGLRAAAAPGVRAVAIANPQHAPYGRAAEEALRAAALLEAVAPRLVLGDNVAQTAQFVDSGSADVGIIALSLALAPGLRDRGKHGVVPEDAHAPLAQGGVVLRWAQDPAAARDLAAFLTGAAGRDLLARYGFGLPPP